MTHEPRTQLHELGHENLKAKQDIIMSPCPTKGNDTVLKPKTGNLKMMWPDLDQVSSTVGQGTLVSPPLTVLELEKM